MRPKLPETARSRGHEGGIALLKQDELLRHAVTAEHLLPKQMLYWALRRMGGTRSPSRLRNVEASIADAERLAALSDALSSLGPRALDSRMRRARQVASGSVTFLNRTRWLSELAWSPTDADRLWAYNLRYFDYAVDLAWAYRTTKERTFLDSFQRRCGSFLAELHGDGLTLEPYPTSVRTINWTQLWLLVGDDLDPEFRLELVGSIRAQLVWLERNLEYHILANHLLKNVQALVIGSIVFSDATARRWRRKFLPVLWEQIQEQVHVDGGHYERSPMYHAEVLGDLLLTVALLRAAGELVPVSVMSRLRGMTQVLSWLTRPNGSLHLFNDSANEIAPRTADLLASAVAVLDMNVDCRPGPVTLPDMGFYGWIAPDKRTRLIIDAGAPAPRYQPGHSHCGILSFELDWHGRSVTVDSGVHGYDGDPYREYVRSTRAHNTVSIGGLEQSEVWATFRIARRARLVSASSSTDEYGFHFFGSYSPYHDRGCLHTREIDLNDRMFIVKDRVTGSGRKKIVSYLHFHPDFAVDLDGHAGVASSAELCVRLELHGFDRIQVVKGSTDPVQGWYCPEFGKALPACVIEMTIDSNDHREFGYVLRRGSE